MTVVGLSEFLTFAQVFGTGNIAAGYDLESIVLDIGTVPSGTGTMTVTVREDASGGPERDGAVHADQSHFDYGKSEYL